MENNNTIFYSDFDMMKKIIKDYSIPVQPVSLTHIDYALKKFPNVFDYEDAIINARRHIKYCGFNLDQFKSDIHKVTQGIIDKIATMDSYKYDFQCRDLPETGFTKDRGLKYNRGLHIYNNNNNGKQLVSIDLTKANLQSFINQGVIENCEYEDFLKKYGEIESEHLLYYIRDSKHLRQIIFGNLNAPRQQQVERIMTEQLLDTLLEKGILHIDDIYGYTTDEIILNYTDNVSDLDDTYFKDIYFACSDLGIKIHTENFILKKIEPYDFWMKVDPVTNQPYKFKNIPVVYFLQVLKHVYKMPVESEDCMFLYDDLPCKFVTKLWEE